MNPRHINIVVPDPIEPPRGAYWAAEAVYWIWHRLRQLASATRVRAGSVRRTCSQHAA
jgi:hypothetical protein